MDRPAGAFSTEVCRAYVDGSYLAATGNTWHAEDAPFKARQVLRMIKRNPSMRVGSICDIGCGTGGVLNELQCTLGCDTRLVGYEVSPQAHRMARESGSRAEFILGDPFGDARSCDLALILDVVEHVEDPFGFMHRCKDKAVWKMYHIPLDVSVSAVLRGANCWTSVGHLHMFTKETALMSVEQSGQRVVDWFLTPVALQRPHRIATRFTNLARRILPGRLASRVFGGYSIMILAR